MEAQVKEKIEKLLRLSKSDNEHEASLAAENARKLMEKHQISMLELDPYAQGLSVVDETIINGNRYEGWYISFFISLAKHFDIQAYRNKTRKGNDLAAIGFKDDLHLFSMSFEYLTETINRLAKKEAEKVNTRGEKIRARKDFSQGCAERILARMSELKVQQQDPEGKALVLRKDEDVNAFVNKFKNFKNTHSVNLGRRSEHYKNGIEAGNTVQLNPQVN